MLSLKVTVQELLFQLSYDHFKVLHHFRGLDKGTLGQLGQGEKNPLIVLKECCADLSSRQSMLLMHVAHIHLVFGQELLHRLLVLLSLLLFLLLQYGVPETVENRTRSLHPGVVSLRASIPLSHPPPVGLLQLGAERRHMDL